MEELQAIEVQLNEWPDKHISLPIQLDRDPDLTVGSWAEELALRRVATQRKTG